MTNKNLTRYQSQANRLGINILAYDVQTLLDVAVVELKSRPDAGTRTLKRRSCTRVPTGMRQETTLYQYYEAMIADTVKQINKHRGVAFVFSMEHIADIIKYEKDAQFTYIPDADCFLVSKED